MNTIGKLLNEVSREITRGEGKYRINIETKIKGASDVREFTFEIYKLKEGQGNLRDVLEKYYGNNVVKEIIKKLSIAITNRTLDSFAKDNIVDFIITGDKVKFVAKTKVSKKSDEKNKEMSESVLDEAKIEIIRKNGKTIFNVNGEKFNGTAEFNAAYPKLVSRLNKFLKAKGYKLRDFEGDDNGIDIVTMADGRFVIKTDPYK